jgi:hypothetical protein
MDDDPTPSVLPNALHIDRDIGLLDDMDTMTSHRISNYVLLPQLRLWGSILREKLRSGGYLRDSFPYERQPLHLFCNRGRPPKRSIFERQHYNYPWSGKRNQMHNAQPEKFSHVQTPLFENVIRPQLQNQLLHMNSIR